MTPQTKNKTVNRIGKNGKAAAPVTVTIPQLDVRFLDLRLIGDSLLVTHAWSDKAKRQMLAKQMKKAKKAKEAKVPAHDFVASLYWLTEKPTDLPEDPDKAMEAALTAVEAGRFGFPAVGFKNCAVSACRFVDGMKMTEARGAFHVVGEMVEIHGLPTMREDMVRVGMGTADIRYRGEFKEWYADVRVRYNATAFSPEQIVNLFNNAGFGVGVGEHRPEKNGIWGMFHVATDED